MRVYAESTTRARGSRPAALGARPVPRGRVLPVATPSAAVPAVHLPADVRDGLIRA